jgi:replicative DNA helicase
VFFVKESSKEELFERIIAQESGISYNRFKFNYQGLNRNEQISIESNYKKFADYWRNIHFYGCDDYDHSLSQMDEILDDINQEHGQIDIVVEDYVQNMRAPRWMRNAPRHEVISYNMEGLSAMHKRHKVAGIVLAQLNREVNSRPTITNLKGSSMLEQEAHIITFLHRERNTKLNNGMLPTDIYCEKQRLGPEFAPIKIGLKIPNVEFIQGRFNEDDHPKDLEMPPA